MSGHQTMFHFPKTKYFTNLNIFNNIFVDISGHGHKMERARGRT